MKAQKRIVDVFIVFGARRGWLVNATYCSLYPRERYPVPSCNNPKRCTNFSNLFLEWNSTRFGEFLCPSSGVFHCTHSNDICHRGLLTVCEQSQDGVTSRSYLQVVRKPVWHIPLVCVQWKTPDDGQRNCPKHVEFYSKNKFEKLVHLVGFIIRIYHDARSPERQNTQYHLHSALEFGRPTLQAVASRCIGWDIPRWGMDTEYAWGSTYKLLAISRMLLHVKRG